MITFCLFVCLFVCFCVQPHSINQSINQQINQQTKERNMHKFFSFLYPKMNCNKLCSLICDNRSYQKKLFNLWIISESSSFNSSKINASKAHKSHNPTLMIESLSLIVSMTAYAMVDSDAIHDVIYSILIHDANDFQIK